MFPKHLAQLVITATQVVGRAFARALREEIRTGRQAAARQAEQNGGTKESAAKATTSNLKYGITLQESVQILNVDPHLNDPAEIKKIYEHLFAVNDKSKGGSFYLQSKVYCAKERIDEELKARGIKVEEDTETASEPAPENEKSTTSEESQSDSSKNTDRS